MGKSDFTELKATFINCTLKKSPRLSHTLGHADVSMSIVKREGVEVDYIRLADHDVRHGESRDMREHQYDIDERPELFKRVISSDILVLGTPIWLGEISSVAKKLIEQLDAMSERWNFKKSQYVRTGK